MNLYTAEDARKDAATHMIDEVPRQVERCLEAIRESASLGAWEVEFHPGMELCSNRHFREFFTSRFRELGYKVLQPFGDQFHFRVYWGISKFDETDEDPDPSAEDLASY